MKLQFGDSFYFLALYSRNDSAHSRAVQFARDLKGTLVTTDWVLTEVADALSSPLQRIGCIALIKDLRQSRHIDVVPASRALFEKGWDLYQRRLDKDWSLTDCISFVVMQERGVTEVLIGDRHFEQAGFRALLA